MGDKSVSFDYDKIKSQEEGGSHWATYSDLFMVLSLVFLLLYVVASLRTGTSNIQNNSKYQEIERERDDLRQQIKVYNTLKDNYLMTGATQDEQKLYKQLMDKLSLLKEEAKHEKNELRKAANENAKKELALNKYQQIIRNIINTNIVSNARIKRRDKTIEKNREDIDSLQDDVKQKKSQLSQGRKKIKSLNSQLDKKVAQLKKSYKKQKISKKLMKKKIADLRRKNKQKVKSLLAQNKKAEIEIQRKQNIIKQTTQKLSHAEETIASQQSSLEQLNIEKQQIIQDISEMREDFKQKEQAEQRKFQQQLKKQKLSAKAKAKKQQEYLKKLKQREETLANTIQGMENQVQKTQAELDQAQKEKSQLAKKSQALSNKARDLASQKQKISKELKRLNDIANAKKKIISDMKANLAKSGLKAEVDGKSGDVIIQFGEEYFDTGKAQLKPGMRSILQKFMPAYSQTLFSNKGTADKISSIEIVGYASPTYKGKYVNPVSLEADNKEAVNYNLDLSYYRARSIFDYIFDTKKMKYKYQRKLLPMVKVTGRSFLAEGANERSVSSMSHKEYCKKFDCKKSQRVVIRFNMEN